jgi:chromate transporter
MEITWLFLVFLRASFLSVSGQTALPILRQDLVASGLMPGAVLIDSLAVGRLGTGPGGLYIVAVGYFVMGIPGALAGLIALMLPPILVVPISNFLGPRMERGRINGFIRGIVLASTGLVAVTSFQLFVAQAQGLSIGAIAVQIGVLVGATVVSLQGRWHPIIVIGIGAVIGLAIGATVHP